MGTDITEFIGVYDADSTLVGEVSYWINARLGRTHCSLCELTHGLFTVKKEWTTCRRALAVPFVTFHRNDAPTDVREAARGEFPVVFARRASGLTRLLGPDELEQFGGSTSRFAAWLETQLG
jgi:hypothetical protein